MKNYFYNSIIIFLFSIQISVEVFAKTRYISGIVFEKGRNIKLSNIQIFVLPDKISAVTNALGEFKIEIQMNELSAQEVQSLDLTLVINAAGFVRYEKIIKKTTDKLATDNFEIYLEKQTVNSDIEIDVVDSSLKQDQSKKTLNRKQIYEVPGANGDPIKAVQNLPGVQRASGFSSQVIIQGADPKDTAYDFDGQEIPLVFHFGGLTSVVMPEAVDGVDFYSAGYQAEHSRALGGLISLKTRNPEVIERPSKGLFYMDNLSMGGLYESKINDSSSFLISGRYSYIGVFLKSAFKNNDALDLTVAPEFMDITSVYQKKISETENFKVSFLDSRDKLAFVFQEPVRENPVLRGGFSNTVHFFRIVPQYFKKINSQVYFKTSLGLGQDQLAIDIGSQFFKLETTNLTTRGELEIQSSDQITQSFGWDNYYSNANVDFKVPIQQGAGGINNPISNGDIRVAQIKNSKINNLGLYSRFEYRTNQQLKLIPNLRLDRFSQTKEFFILPRLAIQYNIDEFKFYKFAIGQYAQNPEPQESSLDFGNPEIKSPTSDHYTLGYEHDFKRGEKNGSLFLANTFYKNFQNLVIQSSKTVLSQGVNKFEVVNNEGAGKAYGTEISLKYNSDAWTCALAYTYTESFRSDPVNGTYRFQFDQTHNLNFITSYDFLNQWKVSGRYRYVTGNPNTPVTGSIYDADNETYFPIRGAIYSDRDKNFQQLDFRIDKKFILDRQIWSFYLDIQNILNIKNPAGYKYSYDYSQKIEVMGLPTIPALGIKGEF